MEGESINLNSKGFRDAEHESKFHARAFLLGMVLQGLMQKTADYIKNETSKDAIRFRRACEFMEYGLGDVFSSTVDALSRCGFFPSSELMYEFDAFQTMLLQGRFKQARDSMRRMLDVCVTSVMFLLGLRGDKEAREWVSSVGETPQFSRTVELLKAHPLIKELDEKFSFNHHLKKQYWYLCDYCHTRGAKFSTGIRQGSQASISGVVLSSFCVEECRKVMVEFANVVSLMAVLFVVHNPVLLVPVDKDAKWGLNGPISGFFYEGQVENLYDVLPEDYTDFFRHYAETNDAIASLRDYLTNLPDLTYDNFKRQAKMFDEEVCK